MGSDNHSQTVKAGNRPKRQRSTSPFGLAAAATDISSSSGTSGTDEYRCNNSISFPTTSGEIMYESTEEEEEEEEEEETDMANCLIMLAQGDSPRSQIIQRNIGPKFQKLNTTSRKFVATVTSNNNKAGLYVYECKTCNRSFPSFQALGGHRASHKKLLLEAEKKSIAIKVDDFHSDSHIQKGNKIHGCSICGSEFISGQALGGHMRRHRPAANNYNNNNNNSSNIGGDHVKPAAVAVAATRIILPLDLNLPAPEDDRHSGIGTTQQSLVLSAPA